jgi:RNA polymerase sigma factor (sigma-70 family)
VSSTATDNELMLDVRNGDMAKLAILFERHHVRLYSFLVRLTNRRDVSEDVVQEVFFRIMRYGHSFRGESPFVVWMYQLARNAASDHFRKRRNEVPLDEELHQRRDPDATLPESYEQHEESELLRMALNRLTAEKREVLILSRYQELKYDEIGRILDCPVGTIKARVHRALKDLKREFDRLSRGGK